MKLILGTVLLCAMGCNGARAEDVVEAKGGQARVRFFGQAAIAIQFHKNQTCIGKRGIAVSKTNMGALLGSSKSISLGMPETPNVASLKSRDGILMPAFYREYAVRANQPITVVAQYYETTGDSRIALGNITLTRPGISRGCSKIGASFTPEDGKDYEVTVETGSPACALTVTQIQTKEAALELTPVAVTEVLQCTAQDVQPLAVCKATLAKCKDGVTEKFRAMSPEGKPDKAAFAACTAEYKACVAET